MEIGRDQGRQRDKNIQMLSVSLPIWFESQGLNRIRCNVRVQTYLDSAIYHLSQNVYNPLVESATNMKSFCVKPLVVMARSSNAGALRKYCTFIIYMRKVRPC